MEKAMEKSIWKKLNEIYDFETTNESLLEMANITGKYMKIEDIDFSFYYSRKNSSHSIRLKINWNRETMTGDDEGYIELHGDYKYYQSPKLKKKKEADIATVRYFAKKYKVLFAAVWECKLDADTLGEYFKGRLSWQELMSSFENINNKEILEVLANCRNLKDLEYAVRKNNAFNMND